MRAGSLSTSIADALADSHRRGYDEAGCRLFAFWQTFGGTAGPFGGIGGAAMTSFSMVVVLDTDGPDSPSFIAYAAGRYLYEVVRLTDEGYERLINDISTCGLNRSASRYEKRAG